MAKATENQNMRHIVGFVRLVVVIVLLAASVFGAHRLLGLSSGAAIVVGGAFAYVASTLIARRLLPELPMWTDEERVCLTPNIPIWLIVGLSCIAVIYVSSGLQLIWVMPVVVVGIGCVIARELHLRKEAQQRLTRTKR
jgi:hypothetical protein